MQKLKIFVCCHKEGFCLKSDVYEPIQAGRAVSKVSLDMLGDDTGDNISGKNKNYCELTAHYWIWKNYADAENVGLCHYRRYFNLVGNKWLKANKGVPESDMPNEVDLKFLEDADVVVPLPGVCVMTMKDYYCCGHIVEDYDILEEVVKELYPDYYEDFLYVMTKNNKCSMWNMIIAKKPIFDAYSEWLFSILFEVEKRVKISEYPNQARVFGYMSELLLNVYLKHNHQYRVKTRPVIWIGENLNISWVKQTLSRWLRNILFALNSIVAPS